MIDKPKPHNVISHDYHKSDPILLIIFLNEPNYSNTNYLLFGSLGTQ